MAPIIKKTSAVAPNLLGVISANSGTCCPRSGEWEVEGMVGTVAYFRKGEGMPNYYGKSVKWILIRSG